MGRMFSLAKVLATSLTAAACGRLGYDVDGPLAQVAQILELDTECGVLAPMTGSLTIANDGTEDLEITSASTTGGFSIVTALPVTIAPGDSAALDIAPPLAVIGTDRAGDRRTGQLTLVTNEHVGARHQVTLGATVIGAELTVTGPGGAPLSLDLTATGGGCPTTSFVVNNTGNEAIGVSVQGSQGLIAGGITSGIVEANSSLSFTVKAMTMSACSGTGSVLVATTSSTTCTAAPTVMAGTFTITGATTCFCS